MELELVTLIGLCGAALLAGFIDAIAGGGGMLTIPAMLTAGLPPHIALGTNKLAATFGSSTASFTFYKKRLFSPQFWFQAMGFTAVGAVLGALLADHLSTELLNRLLPVVVMMTAIYSLLPKADSKLHSGSPQKAQQKKRRQQIQGTSLGFYDGVAGPGTGAFWTVSTMRLYRLDILQASGVAKTMNFISNAIALLTFIALGHVNWFIGLSMGGCIMIGAYFGAHSAIRFGAGFIRPVFSGVVMIMAIKLGWEAWL